MVYLFLTEGSQDEPIQQHHIALDFGDGGMRDRLSDYHDTLRVIIIGRSPNGRIANRR
jgi:hypothetical protein